MTANARHIDAHCHVWPGGVTRFALAPGVSAADRQPAAYPIEMHFESLAPMGMHAAVLVPHIAYYGRDLGYAFDCAARFPGNCAVMGAITQAETEHPEGLASDIERGVRCFRIRAVDLRRPLDELCSWLLPSRSVLCPLITTAQAEAGALERVRTLASCHPGLRFVLDHFGGAPLSDTLRSLAALPNVLLKVSDFGAFDTPPYAQARAATIDLCALFGAERLMWGSNNPVFELDARQSLQAAFDAIHLAPGISAADRDAILGGTAERIFFDH